MIDRQAFIDGVMAREVTLYRVARSLLSRPQDQEDAVQEAVAKAWARRHTLREEKYFATWLIRILINECRTIGRRQKKYLLSDQMADTAAAPHDESDAYHLNALVDALPEKLRLPVVLHYVEGFALREVAELLKWPEGTVKRRLHDARKALRLEFEQEKEALAR